MIRHQGQSQVTTILERKKNREGHVPETSLSMVTTEHSYTPERGENGEGCGCVKTSA